MESRGSKIERAPWFPRGAKYSTVFNGKLWIYGSKTGTTYEQADDVSFMSGPFDQVFFLCVFAPLRELFSPAKTQRR
jgi:hypothetical protein